MLDRVLNTVIYQAYKIPYKIPIIYYGEYFQENQLY